MRTRFAWLAARRADFRWTARRSGAAACLPAALASLLVGVIPGPGMAAARMDVHDQIQRAAGTAPLSLTLMNGLTVGGVFHGFVGDWRDSTHAGARYLAWRDARPEGVPRPGDPLVVVLASGDTLRGRFRGVGQTFLALDTGSPAFVLPVPYSTIRSTGPGAEAPVAEWTELKASLRDAPLLVGVLLQLNSRDMLVEREAISSVRTDRPASSDDAGRLALVLVLGVIAVGVLCVAEMNRASNDLSNSCNSANNSASGFGARYAASNVSGGLAPWRPGETRRP